MIFCVRINWICHFVGCISHHMQCLIAVNMKYLLPATRSFSNFGTKRDGSGNWKKDRVRSGTGILSDPADMSKFWLCLLFQVHFPQHCEEDIQRCEVTLPNKHHYVDLFKNQQNLFCIGIHFVAYVSKFEDDPSQNTKFHYHPFSLKCSFLGVLHFLYLLKKKKR